MSPNSTWVQLSSRSLPDAFPNTLTEKLSPSGFQTATRYVRSLCVLSAVKSRYPCPRSKEPSSPIPTSIHPSCAPSLHPSLPFPFPNALKPPLLQHQKRPRMTPPRPTTVPKHARPLSLCTEPLTCRTGQRAYSPSLFRNATVTPLARQMRHLFDK